MKECRKRSLLPELAITVGLAVLAFLALLKFLPKGGPWGSLVLESAVGGEPAGVHALAGRGAVDLKIGALIGQVGVAATPLFPSGQVEIGGRRYEARMAMGFAEAGVPDPVLARHPGRPGASAPTKDLS